jgi:hypothetical protein
MSKKVIVSVLFAMLAAALAGRAAPAPQRPAVADLRSFGATGDGRADDSAAFRAAIAQAEKASVPIYVPAGRYLLRGRFLLHVPVYGDWSRSSILLLRGPDSGLIVGESEQVYIRDLAVEGDGSKNQVGIMVGDKGRQADFCYMQRLEVRRCGSHGIWLRKGNCCTIRDVRSFGNYGCGLLLDAIPGDDPNGGYCTNSHQIHAYLVGNSMSGLKIGHSGSNVIDVTAEGNGAMYDEKSPGGWGLEIDSAQRLITCYTEGNGTDLVRPEGAKRHKGGIWCKPDCYGAIINCWSWEGVGRNPGRTPLIENHNNLAIWGQTQRAPWQP